MEAAIARFPNDNFVINWKPYFLRPNHPRDGVAKSPDTPENPRVGQRMKAAGLAVDIDFTGKCDRSPNSIFAHCLLAYALDKHGPQVQGAVQERLFHGYFTAGIYPDVDNLVALVTRMAEEEKAGEGKGTLSALDPAEVRRVLESGELEQQIMQEAKKYSTQVQGVPFFYINGQPAFSGAQDPNTFAEVFQSC
mmetsp:Transcript_69945/g.145828  ORF Transcript_69945/g.145828 Transcript_69945/m.145828 type:complete len:193 (-) Transcript_69945:337-915(-)|eukprot:CAMPEP_0181294988 /NCGR_PEP_ID=MMETSP1101-20121128/3899_1 /TAXON_ID=46948 /ORGANISM="Rhodomonas abbreviata, Strain Caron Lab Isolate" /LENGTH=192 /DNA_ID=CAMNT_0023399693 /DNA_START=181 /DNA_END=759 /DNA_ORIENTATION=-